MTTFILLSSLFFAVYRAYRFGYDRGFNIKISLLQPKPTENYDQYTKRTRTHYADEIKPTDQLTDHETRGQQ